MIDTTPRRDSQRIRVITGFIIQLLGFVIFVLGVRPDAVGLDRSEVTGFVQISVFLVGLGFICIGGYITLNACWNGKQKSIPADIGIRLVATGFVIAIASGLSDVFGLGSQVFPKIPSFGPVQALGVMLGELTIAFGFLLFIPSPRRKPTQYHPDQPVS